MLVHFRGCFFPFGTSSKNPSISKLPCEDVDTLSLKWLELSYSTCLHFLLPRPQTSHMTWLQRGPNLWKKASMRNGRSTAPLPPETLSRTTESQNWMVPWRVVFLQALRRLWALQWETSGPVNDTARTKICMSWGPSPVFFPLPASRCLHNHQTAAKVTLTLHPSIWSHSRKGCVTIIQI